MKKGGVTLIIDREKLQHNFEEMVPSFSKQEAIEEANRCLYCYDAPCIKACPTGIDIPSFIKKIATDNVKGSARIIMEANPIGATCSRVCPTEELCEGACVLNDSTKPILIGMLQRYATDHAITNQLRLFSTPQKENGTVAVIGSGPAGLSAARQLALLGYDVTVFEAEQEGGGLNRTGIVSFRLPKSIPTWEVQQVKDLGVTFFFNTMVGRDISFAQLQEQFDAIIVAVGLGKVPALGLEVEENVIDALEFIRQTKEGTIPTYVKDKKVVVIGAGNTAIDAATCAIRLGAEKVTMMYRRTEKEMTAYQFEYESAKQHGVQFQFLATPVRIQQTIDKLQIQWMPMKLGEIERDGRRRPIPASSIPIKEEVDYVIRAIGQERFIDFVEQIGIKHNKGVIAVTDGYETNIENVFACGDCIFEKGLGEATVVHAAQQGKEVAKAVHHKLQANLIQGKE
ncbi:MAG: NAD(P)-dependent oxidoreductase [Bacillaceae bacterium]